MKKITKQLQILEEERQIQDNNKKDITLFESYLYKNNSPFKDNIIKRYKKGISINTLRKELAAVDLEYFARAYLPHYFTREIPTFHKELDNIWLDNVIKNKNVLVENEEINKMQGCKVSITAPRGHAKSTNFTFKDTLHACLYKYKNYILILSDSSEQAEGFLDDIKTELEENELIKKDFGNMVGKVWNSSVILLSNNVKIEAIGSGKKIRGRRHRNFRPDLIVLDDIENDENVNTFEQRKKLENWFYKAVSKAGDTYTDICYIGTLLHYDSLLAKVIKNPTYKVAKYQGVIQFAKNKGLWDIWEKIFLNLEDEEREENAKEFFEANKQEMLEHTKVLWEEKWSYYDLMVMRLSEGIASFNSEIQNEPINPEDCLFNPEWFEYYNKEQIDFKNKDFIFFGAVDPSLAKNKNSDTSAIVILAKNIKSGYLYVLKASIERRKPDVIIEDIINLHKKLINDYGKGFTLFGVEEVQFQSFFKDVLKKECLKRKIYLNVEGIKNTTNKNVRIESLQPYIKNGYVKFNKDDKTLIQQLEQFPLAKYDDGADALEMVVKLAINNSNSNKPDYKTVIKRSLNFRKGAY